MNIIETNLSFGSMSKRKKTNRIILHHAAASTCDAATIHRWHKAKGWSGAGYHFLVRKDGKIYRLRPEDKVGAHASGNNSDSLGICFEGNFQTETMGQTQINAGKELVAHLKNKYNISKVQKHKDVGSTACPGANFPFVEITSESMSASGDKSGCPFLVKITVPDLTIRAGAGMNTKELSHITDGGTYTIVEVRYNGPTPWGRLKSGAGWISLVEKYVKRV